MNNLSCRISYKGFSAMQHENVFKVFQGFLEEIKPSNILEIGTAEGGFIYGIRDILNTINLSNCNIRTFDIYPNEKRSSLSAYNIEIYTENVFDDDYNLINPELIVPFIQRDGTTIVFCDGGNKAKEFNCLAKYLKNNDLSKQNLLINEVHNGISSNEALDNFKLHFPCIEYSLVKILSVEEIIEVAT